MTTTSSVFSAFMILVFLTDVYIVPKIVEGLKTRSLLAKKPQECTDKELNSMDEEDVRSLAPLKHRYLFFSMVISSMREYHLLELFIVIFIMLLFYSPILVTGLRIREQIHVYLQTEPNSLLKKLSFISLYITAAITFFIRSFFLDFNLFNQSLIPVLSISWFLYATLTHKGLVYVLYFGFLMFALAINLLLLELRAMAFSDLLINHKTYAFCQGFNSFRTSAMQSKFRFIRGGTQRIFMAISIGETKLIVYHKTALYITAGAVGAYCISDLIHTQCDHWNEQALQKTILDGQKSAQDHSLTELREKNAHERASWEHERASWEHKERMAQLQAQQHSGFRSTLKNLWRRE